MKAFSHILLAILFLASALLNPWWLTLLIGIFLLGVFPGLFSIGTLILGGFLMDSVFGAPVYSLGGFKYLYTALCIILSLVSFFLRNTLSE
jgi:hypothetical protein